MSYIDDNLMTGETVIYRAKLHWIIYKWPVIWLLLAIVLGSEAPDLMVGFIFLSILTGVISYMDFTTSEFGLTNKRVVLKYGIIRRHSLDTLLTKVEGFTVDQGILGRALDYGTITVRGGSGTPEKFNHISAPFEFKKKVQEQIG